MLDIIKGTLKSKTIWVAVLGILVTALYDPVQVWIAANPGLAGTVAGLVMAALRTVTTSSIASKGTTPS